MFDTLTERLGGVFQRLGRRGRLSEKDVTAALREVRMALLEADVNFKVARDLVAGIRERAVGAEVLESVTPAQQVIKIVNDQLVELLGTEAVPLETASQPAHRRDARGPAGVGQDHDGGQAGVGSEGPRWDAAAGGRRYAAARRHRPARHAGRAGRSARA